MTHEDFAALPFVQACARMCETACGFGWHERNAGNVSCRLTDDEATLLCPGASLASSWTPLSQAYPHVGGAFFAVTAAGSFLSALPLCPEPCMGVIRLSPEGDAWQTVAGFRDGTHPTSELESHLGVHQLFAGEGWGMRVVYHAHTPALITATNVLPPDSDALTAALWSAMIECVTIFPRGVGLVPQAVPGTIELAEATIACLRRHDAAAWAGHGLLCAGVDFDDALGMAQAIEKAARIWCDMRLLSGDRDDAGVGPAMVRRVAEAYGLHVRLDKSAGGGNNSGDERDA